MPVIEIRHLTHIYAKDTSFAVTALDDVSLSIEKGDFFAIVGSTGSGKTTLVQHMNGLLAPSAGSLSVCGAEIVNKSDRRNLWRRVGLVFQQPEHQLFEETVRDDIAFGPRNLGLSASGVQERVDDAMKMVDLDPAQIGDLSPLRLSGGLRRKVAIAGVLALWPEVLVLDEPTAGLDPVSRQRLMARIQRLRTERGMTVVLVTHNMEDVAAWANRMAVLHRGRLIMAGDPREVFAQGETLRRIGLDVPATVRLMQLLRAKGLDLPVDLLTIEEVVAEIAPFFEVRGR